MRRSRAFALALLALLALNLAQWSGLHFHSHLNFDHGAPQVAIEVAAQGAHLGTHADDRDINWPGGTLIQAAAHFSLDVPPLAFALLVLFLALPSAGEVHGRRPREDRYRPPARHARPQGRAPPFCASIRFSS